MKTALMWFRVVALLAQAYLFLLAAHNAFAAADHGQWAKGQYYATEALLWAFLLWATSDNKENV